MGILSFLSLLQFPLYLFRFFIHLKGNILGYEAHQPALNFSILLRWH